MALISSSKPRTKNRTQRSRELRQSCSAPRTRYRRVPQEALPVPLPARPPAARRLTISARGSRKRLPKTLNGYGSAAACRLNRKWSCSQETHVRPEAHEKLSAETRDLRRMAAKTVVCPTVRRPRSPVAESGVCWSSTSTSGTTTRTEHAAYASPKFLPVRM